MRHTTATSAPSESLARRRHRLALLGMLTVYLALLSWGLGSREFALDEQISVGHTEGPEYFRDAFHPPGYYWLLYQWRQVWGGSDVALRAFSVPWALLAWALVALLAGAALRPPQALAAVVLFTVSPAALLYLRMVRYFGVTLTLAAAAGYVALRAREGRARWPYPVMGLLAAALLAVNYTAAALLPLLYLWTAPAAWRSGRRGWWLLSAAVPLTLVAVKLPGALAGARAVAEIPATYLHLTPHGLLLKLGFPLYSALVGETTFPWTFAVVLPTLAAGLALVAAGAAALIREQHPHRALLLGAWPAAVLLVVGLLSTVAASEPWARVSSLSLFGLPFLLLVAARGVGALRRPWGALCLAALLLGQGYGAHNYLAGREFLNPGYRAPWREVNRLIQAQGGPGDLALTVFDGTLERYWEGPVRYLDIFSTERPPPVPEVRFYPADEGELWVISRDRGSDLARELTADLVAYVEARGDPPEVYRIGRLSAQERRWRERLGGRSVQEAQVLIYRFRPSVAD